MSTEWRNAWEPGDVGVTAKGRLALRRHNSPDGWIDSHGAPWSNDKFPTNVRPLIVIDPEDAEQVERLYVAVWRAFNEVPEEPVASEDVQDMQAALREFARPTPRIEEPTGLGAVVEDAGGQRFVRMHDGWWRSDEPCTVNWAAIDAVRVASPGVTP